MWNIFYHSCTFVRDMQCLPYKADMRRCISRVPASSAIKKRTTPLCYLCFAIHSWHATMYFACSSILSHQETNYTSLLFFALLPFPMLDEHTLHYAHLQSNKETTVWTCAFSLCMSATLQMTVSIRNNSVASFCEECVSWRVFDFNLTDPHSSNQVSEVILQTNIRTFFLTFRLPLKVN